MTLVVRIYFVLRLIAGIELRHGGLDGEGVHYVLVDRSDFGVRCVPKDNRAVEGRVNAVCSTCFGR